MFDPLRSKTRLLLITFTAFVVGAGGATAMGWTSLTATPAFTEAPQVSDEAVRPALDLNDAFVNVAQAVTPAVIRIEAERPGTAAAQRGMEGLPFPEEFRRFFDLPDAPQGPQDPIPQTAGGSGFIVSPDGYILTNDHVVSGATQIRVFLADRREYTAEIVGTDPTTDVAVIKINGQNLPTLSLGSSLDVRVGEWVLAVGNPGFGGSSTPLDHTVTAGIVSATGRPLQLIQGELRRQEEWQEVAGYAIEDFIQTDAVINPGNSGGPLVNVRGQVVGINSAIASRTGFYQGYGFAIPIDLAKRIMQDLVEFGEVRRARLGIEMWPVDPVDAELYGLPRTTGVLVQNVLPGGPAEAAGIRQEDVIVAVDDQEIDRPGQLQSTIAQKRPGDRVDIRLFRGGSEQVISVRLDQAPLTPRTVQAAAPEAAVQSLLGMEFAELDEATARQLGYDSAGGVVVGRVTPAGPAQRRGVQSGERVRSVNGEETAALTDAQRVLEGLDPGDIVSLRLERPDGSSRVVNIRIPE